MSHDTRLESEATASACCGSQAQRKTSRPFALRLPLKREVSLNYKKWLACAFFALSGLNAYALTITKLSPQGEVGNVRQVVAKFDQAAVNFGDPKAVAPLTVTCSDELSAKGNGRWTGDKEWVFQFERDLPPGVRCTARINSDFQSPKGSELTVPASAANGYRFNTSGPSVRIIVPTPTSA
jgi:hypothetical protein